MKIRALIPFTLRDPESGDLYSLACGAVTTASDELGAQLISDGLAEEYKLIEPTGTVTITENGDVDVTEYATATVNVS